MTLITGTKLASYEVVAQIGAGGMGEVYEARDTKLGRNVAIKVLPAAFANNPERLARFQREAKMLAALNHPNIATIHGLECSDGIHFLVMELVQGETLAERVKSGPLPMEETLKIAVQIADALEAAHEKNIIHRDLKPANVKVTPDGRVKVLDSGSDIWVYEWRRDTMTRLTSGGAGAYINPTWSPDGRYILFSGLPPDGIFWTRSDGATKPQLLTQSANLQVPFSFTADGKRLSFNEAAPGSQYDIWTVTVQRDAAGLHANKPEPFLRTPFDERQPVLSPDGGWLAYTANDSGTYQVYVRSFPDRGGKWQISNDGGSYPEWSRNGHELFFRSADNHIMVASYTMRGDSFAADRPRVWSEKRLADFGSVGIRSYDLAPDGKRVIALMSPGTPQAQAAQNHVIFLENFFDELRRRIPAGK